MRGVSNHEAHASYRQKRPYTIALPASGRGARFPGDPIYISNSDGDISRHPRGTRCPSFELSSSLVNQRARRDPQERARGKPGADRTHGPRATIESTGVGPQVNRSKPGFPRAMVYGLLRALPGDRALLSPSSARLVTRLRQVERQRRGVRTTRLHRPRAPAFVVRQGSRPPHPTATFVTCATPLLTG
jgi:hypothetical protein